MKILLLLGLLAVSATGQQAATEESKLNQLIDELKTIEDDLMKTVYTDVKNDISAAADKKKQLEDAAMAELERKASEAKEKVNEAINKFNEAKAAAEAKIEQERQKMIDDFKAKVEQKKAAKAAEKQAAKEKFEKLAQQVKDKLQAKKAEKERKRQELNAKLTELQETVKENRELREQEKEARKAEQKAERDTFLQNYASERASLKEERKTLVAEYEALKEKDEALKESLKTAFGQSLKTEFGEAVEDYLQERLEKEFVNKGVENILYPSKEAEKTKLSTTGSVDAAPKASLIDTLSGKSSWETVTWVLLALCIILAIALVAIIVFQVLAKNKENGNYQRLDGHNETGIVGPGNEKQGLLHQPKHSGAPYLGGQGDPGTSSAPPSAPVHDDQQQQF